MPCKGLIPAAGVIPGIGLRPEIGVTPGGGVISGSGLILRTGRPGFGLINVVGLATEPSCRVLEVGFLGPGFGLILVWAARKVIVPRPMVARTKSLNHFTPRSLGAPFCIILSNQFFFLDLLIDYDPDCRDGCFDFRGRFSFPARSAMELPKFFSFTEMQPLCSR